MENTINERISEIISNMGYKSKRAFAEKIGVAQTSLNDILNGAEPKFSTLNKILIAEPLISAEWIMRGEGGMLRNEEDKVLNPAPKKYDAELEIDNEGYLKIKIKK